MHINSNKRRKDKGKIGPSPSQTRLLWSGLCPGLVGTKGDVEPDPSHSDFTFDSDSLHHQRRMETPSASSAYSGSDFQSDNGGMDKPGVGGDTDECGTESLVSGVRGRTDSSICSSTLRWPPLSRLFSTLSPPSRLFFHCFHFLSASVYSSP